MAAGAYLEPEKLTVLSEVQSWRWVGFGETAKCMLKNNLHKDWYAAGANKKSWHWSFMHVGAGSQI